MNVVRLAGCGIEPLGSYLKALAVLRLVAEQADANARGWWDGMSFCLETELDTGGLVEFFLKRYSPTPILSPWNGGSGFYPKDRKAGLEAIAGSTAERFSVYSDAIRIAGQIRGVGEEKGANKAEEDARRFAIQLECRNQLPDRCVEWLDAAVGISAEGKRTFAPILGTGGNEGRLDYTNNFMEYLAVLLIQADGKMPVEELLGNALFGTATDGFVPSAVGQYDPGRAGGFNQGPDVETKDFPSNPWNFVLTLEGGVAWASGLYRRQGVAYRSFLCSPFTVMPTPVGYGSAAEKDGQSARAEIWAPIWEKPASYREIRALLREGRAALDGRPAQNGLEFAEAACLLGVDRGISGFVRYNLLKRRGDSYIALPAGRYRVRQDAWEGDLVRQLNQVLDSMDGQMKSPPAEYASLRRQVDEAMFNVLVRGGEDALEDVAASMGRLHRRVLLTGRDIRIRGRLSSDWVSKLDTRPEARIAAALASIWDRDAAGMEPHLNRAKREYSWSGASLEERMARTLERRMVLAEQLGLDRNPLGGSYRINAHDVTMFLDRAVDDERIEDLLFAFLLVDWSKAKSPPFDAEHNADVWPVYTLLKRLYTAGQIETKEGKRHVVGDLGVLAALTGAVEDGVTQAARIASGRLRNIGIAAEMESASGFDGMRLAGALLIPVQPIAARGLFKTTGEGK
jgi:CRISPR-associated protein Csx17